MKNRKLETNSFAIDNKQFLNNLLLFKTELYDYMSPCC